MDRESLIAKIRALTAKTVANGCSEAEAIAAAEKVAELMQRHAISETLLEMENASLAVKFNTRSSKALICSAVAVCTNCAVVHTTDGKEKTVLYVGLAPGPQIACYLHDVMHRAVDHAVKDFRMGSFYRARRSDKTRRKAVADFTDGMVRRLFSRLVKMFGATIDDGRRMKAKTALSEMFPQSKTVQRRDAKTRFAEANWYGEKAADKVNLSRAVEGDAAGRLLGHGG